MSRITRDSYAAMVLIVIFSIVLWDIRDLNKMSAIFPKTITIILLGLSVIYLVFSLVKKTEDSKPFASIEKKKVFILCAGMVGFIVFIWIIGFLTASLIFIAFYVWYLQGSEENQRRRILRSGLSSVIVSIGFYLLFQMLLNVPLPKGVFL